MKNNKIYTILLSAVCIISGCDSDVWDKLNDQICEDYPEQCDDGKYVNCYIDIDNKLCLTEFYYKVIIYKNDGGVNKFSGEFENFCWENNKMSSCDLINKNGWHDYSAGFKDIGDDYRLAVKEAVEPDQDGVFFSDASHAGPSFEISLDLEKNEEVGFGWLLWISGETKYYPLKIENQQSLECVEEGIVKKCNYYGISKNDEIYIELAFPKSGNYYEG